MKKWDFGMYINRVIAGCWRKERLFGVDGSTLINTVSSSSAPVIVPSKNPRKGSVSI